MDCNRHSDTTESADCGQIFGSVLELDEWMQDWLAKRQPAPNASGPHPASRAFVRYIHENHAKNGQWPVHDDEQDTQFLHAVYLPSDISDKWEAAPDTDVGSNGGEPNGGHAPADATPEAVEGRAAADVEHNTDVGSDGCETYGWDEGCGGGSDGFVEKISNNGMLCVSLVVLISSGQNRLEFDL